GRPGLPLDHDPRAARERRGQPPRLPRPRRVGAGDRRRRVARRLAQPKTPTSIFAQSKRRTMAKTRLSVGTGRRCASLAPRGAVSVLTAAMSTSAGTWTKPTEYGGIP